MSIAELKLDVFKKMVNLPDEQFMEAYKLLLTHVFQTPTSAKKQRTIGSMKGILLYMADDFDAPLDDFKEYMP
jgi:hypothetical protein